MRSKVLLLSALLHGAGITCAVVAVHAATAKAPPAPRLAWLPSRDPPSEPPRLRPYDPFRREDPGPFTAEPDAAPSEAHPEPFDPEVFAPAPPSAPPPAFRDVPPIPDVRIRPPEPTEQQEVEREPETPPGEVAPSDAAYVEARVLESENEPPRYPRRARLMGWEGEVHVEVLVGADGRAGEVRLAKGCRHPVLNREALRAVREWRFLPASRGGRPEPAVILVPVEFRLK